VGLFGGRRHRQAWMVELALIVVLATIYNWVRAQQGTDAALAIRHGLDIADLEGPLFDHIETPLNHWIAGVPFLAVASCYFYALMHYAMTPGVLFLSWRKGGWHYHRGYWSLIIASGIALVIYAKFPVAPPRLLPQLGITDIMRQFSQFGWWGAEASAPRGLGDATNQYAAMPSLHFGWSLWCGIQMWNWSNRLWRIPAVVYPTLQVLVVLATGNHFLFDVLAGAGCVVAAHIVVGMLKFRIERADDARAAGLAG
jgi:PAP2 superfamily